MRIRTLLLASSLFLGCRADLPDAHFACTTDSECPDDWSCWSEDQRCHRDPDPNPNPGTDAGPGMDAGDATPACVPTGETDVPDANRVDADCDGIDGVITDSVFVDGTGGNDADAGTQAAPVATIAKGLEIAAAESKHALILTGGTYNGQVVLVAGIGIHGGYVRASQWSRAPITAVQTTILTATSSPVLVATSITTATRVTGVQIQAPNATAAGTSSIAVKITDSNASLSIENATIRAGTGAQGNAGTMSAVVPVGGNTGMNGNNAEKKTTGFVGGSLVNTAAPCSCGRGAVGVFGWSNSGTDRNGFGGEFVNGAGTCATATAGGSAPSDGAPAGSTNSTVRGRNGATGANGAAGSAGQFAGAVVESGFSPLSGGAGGNGGPGGGGGSGASGLVYACTNESNYLISASAGAGGSGGCGGGGGTGGSGGGASIGMHLWRSTPTLVGVTLVTSDGGTGGAGGAGRGGAGGGMGGEAGLNTTATCDGVSARTASGGGMGGTGGSGGQGGGGAGGPSIAIVLGTDASLAAGSTLNVTMPGAGGAGGTGGNSGVTGGSCATFTVAGAVCAPTL